MPTIKSTISFVSLRPKMHQWAGWFSTVTHCNAQQHTATHCNTLQHTATYSSMLHRATLFSTSLRKHVIVNCLPTISEVIWKYFWKHNTRPSLFITHPYTRGFRAYTNRLKKKCLFFEIFICAIYNRRARMRWSIPKWKSSPRNTH